jgi:anti-anti-sigma factor
MSDFTCDIGTLKSGGLEVLIVRPRGNLSDPEDVLPLESKLDELLSNRKSGVVDLRALTYVNSVGLGALVVKFRNIRNAGGELVLMKPRQLMERMFRVAGVSEFMPIYHDLNTAVERNEYMKTLAASKKIKAALYKYFEEELPPQT